MNKSLLMSLIMVLAIIFSGCQFSQQLTRNEFPQKNNPLSNQNLLLTIGENNLLVEVVDEPATISLGLGNRDEIGSDGMLFVLPQKQLVTFWMMGMKFPLDMIWIDQGEVIGITADVPVIDPNLDLSQYDPPVYPSSGAVTHVLEINAGRARELGIKQGDQVVISRPI